MDGAKDTGEDTGTLLGAIDTGKSAGATDTGVLEVGELNVGERLGSLTKDYLSRGPKILVCLWEHLKLGHLMWENDLVLLTKEHLLRAPKVLVCHWEHLTLRHLK